MRQGKLTNQQLDSLILSKFAHTRKEVVCSPHVGVDCAAVDLGGRIAVLSTDPITSADKNLGSLTVHVSCNDAAAAEIFKVDSFSSGFTFINTASIFFAQYIPQAPVEVKCLPIGGVLPTSADIISGKYPLSVRYVIAYKENSARLQLLLKELKKDKYRTQMANSGLIVL